MKRLIVLITALILTGCYSGLKVDGNAVMIAGNKCDNNGGVHEFKLYPSDQIIIVQCYDGAKYENTVAELLNENREQP